MNMCIPYNMIDNIELSIIIVNWNSWSYIQNCIRSIKENAVGIMYELIVVDNCSSDNSIDNISSCFPDVILIKNDNNIGFPAANNQAFNIARGQYFLMLNPDTLINKNTLQQSLHVLRNDDSIGCIGVKTLKRNGKILLSCARSYDTLWSKFCQLFYLDIIFNKYKLFASTDMAYWDHNNSCDVDLLHGGCMMFPESIYRNLGGLDDKIPMFYDDVEYCCRIKKAGFRIYYLADVDIVHYVGVSSSKADQKWIMYMYCESCYLYFLEYGGGKYIALIYAVMLTICFPFRLIYSPFIWIGYILKNRKFKSIKLIIIQITASAIWAIKKLHFITVMGMRAKG